MEEKITYRYLRKSKPRTIKNTSQSLLQSYPHKSKRPLKGIMAKNVSMYKHMLEDPKLKENYIDWAINLRGYEKTHLKEREEDNIPSVYYKKTMLTQMRNTTKDSFHNSLNKGDFCHYFHRNASYANENSLHYMTKLRSPIKGHHVKP